jgi:hypothetical protein
MKFCETKIFHHNDRQYLFKIMKYSYYLQNMVYLQNLHVNDKDNAVQMQYNVLSIPVYD